MICVVVDFNGLNIGQFHVQMNKWRWTSGGQNNFLLILLIIFIDLQWPVLLNFEPCIDLKLIRWASVEDKLLKLYVVRCVVQTEREPGHHTHWRCPGCLCTGCRSSLCWPTLSCLTFSLALCLALKALFWENFLIVLVSELYQLTSRYACSLF